MKLATGKSFQFYGGNFRSFFSTGAECIKPQIMDSNEVFPLCGH